MRPRQLHQGLLGVPQGLRAMARRVHGQRWVKQPDNDPAAAPRPQCVNICTGCAFMHSARKRICGVGYFMAPCPFTCCSKVI